MFEAYKVAVQVSLKNQVSAGLARMSEQFVRLHGNAQMFRAELEKIKGLGIISGAAGAGAWFGFHAIHKTLKPAAEYAHQIAAMNVSGMKHIEIVKAINAAWAAGRTVPTSSAAENLSTIGHLRMVFGNTDAATKYMPVVQKIQAMLESFVGRSAGDQSYDVAKSLEMKGATRTPGQFRTQADLMLKAIIASHGKVRATDFLSAFKYGRTATSMWDNTFTYDYLPTLIQEMKTRGGSGGTGGPGNALMSAYAAVVGGTISQKSLGVWNRLGLLNPKHEVWTASHQLRGLTPGGIVGSALFQQNPYDWTRKVLLPAMEKAGYKTPQKQIEMLESMFQNRTASFIIAQMLTQGWKFQRDRGLIEKAAGLAGYQQMLKQDPEMAQMALHKQWQNLMAIMGYTIMPKVLKGAQLFINIFGGMARFFNDHQDMAKGLMYGLLGLSTILAGFSIIGSTVTAFKLLRLAMVGISGLEFAAVAPGIIAVTAALAGLFALFEAKKSYHVLKDQVKKQGFSHLSLWERAEYSILGAIPFIGSYENQKTPTQVNIHLNGHKVGEALIPANAHGTAAVNPSAHRPMPAMAGIGGSW